MQFQRGGRSRGAPGFDVLKSLSDNGHQMTENVIAPINKVAALILAAHGIRSASTKIQALGD